MSATQYDSFMALADPNRREILMMLTEEKRSINTLAEAFEISRPAVSKHVKVLVETGFVNIEVKGRERLCSLSSEGFEEIRDWINYFEQFWNSEMSRLETLFRQKENKTGDDTE